MSKETFTITLKEQCADAPSKNVEVTLLSEGGQLWVQPDGYGDKGSAEGHGYPVGMEVWEGRLRLIVYDNINVEDPQIIDLENARETRNQVNSEGVKS